jgi:signal transduction histidine kinase
MEFRPKRAIILFLFITLVLFAQSVWWITFMAILIDEKVEMAVSLGADEIYVENMHNEEISRQMMIGMEGLFFLVLISLGAWMIYRALVKTEELKFHQQNFLMAVTHELKTPLSSMKIYLDTLQNEKIPYEKKQDIIPKVKEDTYRLEKLVENILEAGRFERRGYHLNKEQFNLSSMVDETVENIKKHPLGKRLEISKVEFEDNLVVNGDKGALKRAVDAILENSLKYNEQDIVKINISLILKSRFVHLSISDNGIGLTKKDSTRIFNRFYRVGEEIKRSTAGSGLGLFLCREIIKAHSGTVEAVSEGIGKGVSFNIKLKTGNNHENNSAG